MRSKADSAAGVMVTIAVMQQGSWTLIMASTGPPVAFKGCGLDLGGDPRGASCSHTNDCSRSISGSPSSGMADKT